MTQMSLTVGLGTRAYDITIGPGLIDQAGTMLGEIAADRHIIIVSDDQVRDAMRFAFSTLKLVVEPGGAVPLAAMLAGLAPPCDGASVVVMSGSNVDPAMFAEIIAG